MMYASSPLCHDNEVPQWNYPHLLKTVYQECGTITEIAQVKAILQQNIAIILGQYI